MVTAGKAYSGELYFLSVLALSSRFDGPGTHSNQWLR